MPEPEQLKRGKIFQKIVQEDYKQNSKDGDVKAESIIILKNRKGKRGRIDILIKSLEDYVTVIEIKATDWDKIKKKNITKNLYSHQRQLYKYIEKFLDIDKVDVCPRIIYPKPPQDKQLKDRIENYLSEYGAPVYWYSEVKTISNL